MPDRRRAKRTFLHQQRAALAADAWLRDYLRGNPRRRERTLRGAVAFTGLLGAMAAHRAAGHPR